VLSPALLEYQATEPLVPGTVETITVPGGASGIVGSRGQHLATTFTSSFTVAPGSTLRLQQMLAELGYLPLGFTPAAPLTSPTQEGAVQIGTFTWRWPDQPTSLTSLWTPGTYDVITKGAVMNFEAQHGLKVDGIAGPQVWSAVLTALENGQGDALPYDYVYVSKVLPETTTVYENGSVVYQTLANTGVAAAPTADGTFPVYARYTVTTMTGTNPDGSKYVDPGIPWVSYFNGGDALHGFPRASYGFPQSVGCVEMPIAHAAVVYPLTPLGTLVTVS
jgi:peptidoglycan hydrolase-like protein with peptidoglycan-binding domain